MTITTGKKYQTRNGRVVTINEQVPGGLTDRGEPKPDFFTGQMNAHGQDTWSLTGAYKAGSYGVPHMFDLVHEILGGAA
jgi:hypothetical protein